MRERENEMRERGGGGGTVEGHGLDQTSIRTQDLEFIAGITAHPKGIFRKT